MKLLSELRSAARRLWRAPQFSIPVVATLALGVGAITAVFSVVHGVLIRPLPYPDSDRLVWLDHGAPGLDVSQGLTMTEGIFVHYRRHSRTLDRLALYEEEEVNLTGDASPERVRAAVVTPSLFRILGASAKVGRPFIESDLAADEPAAVILDYALWSRRFGRDPAVVGRTIELDGREVAVVGVMPPDFSFPSDDTELWLPLVVDSSRFGGFTRRGIARLAAGVKPAAAEADLQRLIPDLVESFPGPSAKSAVEEARLRARVVPLKDHIVGETRRALWLVLATVALVLLISCVNVANLLLVRSETREREVAVRTALGASRTQMARHFLAESIWLAGAGAVAGLALSAAGVELIRSLGTASLPRLHEVKFDVAAPVFAAGLALALALAFAAVPTLRGVPQLVGALREGGRGATTGRRRVSLRHALVAGQVALALVLLIGAGLMLRTYRAIHAIDPGLRPENVLTFEVGLPPEGYPNREAAVAFHEELLERLEALPGVISAGASTCLPLCGSWNGYLVQVEDRPPRPGELPPVVATRRVSPGYLETLGTPLRSGRLLERADHEHRTGAAVINVAMADAYWPGEEPLGQRFYHELYDESPAWYTVVGVVENMPIRDPTEEPARTVYLPLLHLDGAVGPSPHRLGYAVRSAVPPLALAGAVRRTVWSLDGGLPVASLRTMEGIISGATVRMQFTMIMLLVSAGAALALGAVGLYGVVSYVVGRRTREFGVRKALGAEAARIRTMVVRQGAVVAAVGIVLGLVASIALARTMEALLYGVTPVDPVTYVGVSALLLAVVIVASWIPARRAARVDPAEALRAE